MIEQYLTFSLDNLVWWIGVVALIMFPLFGRKSKRRTKPGKSTTVAMSSAAAKPVVQASIRRPRPDVDDDSALSESLTLTQPSDNLADVIRPEISESLSDDTVNAWRQPSSFKLDAGIEIQEDASASQPVAAAVSRAPVQGSSLTLDDEQSSPGPVADVRHEQVEMTPVTASSLELESDSELSTPGSVLDNISDSDEMETRLDLATAYLEIGDAGSAGPLLDEIIAKGSPEQQQQAQTLKQQL